MSSSAQDADARMAQAMLVNPFYWADAWQRAGAEAWKVWWEEYARLLAESSRLFVTPIPF